MPKWIIWLTFAFIASLIEVSNGVNLWVGAAIYGCGVFSALIGNAVDE